MTIEEYASAMDAWRQQSAEQAAAVLADHPCVLEIRYGEGSSETIARLAAARGTDRIAVLAPLSSHENIKEGIARALAKLGIEGTVRTFKGRDGGGEACHAAARDISGKYLFCLLAPNQAASAGSWCASRRESPFGLAVADICEMYANPLAERTRGLAAMASAGTALAGIAHDAASLADTMRSDGPFRNAIAVRLPVPEERSCEDAESA